MIHMPHPCMPQSSAIVAGVAKLAPCSLSIGTSLSRERDNTSSRRISSVTAGQAKGGEWMNGWMNGIEWHGGGGCAGLLLWCLCFRSKASMESFCSEVMSSLYRCTKISRPFCCRKCTQHRQSTGTARWRHANGSNGTTGLVRQAWYIQPAGNCVKA